jgi:hypothetical protein
VWIARGGSRGRPDSTDQSLRASESGIRFERPNAFEGKKIDDVNDAELAELIRHRNAQAVQRAPGIGGADTGAGPVHGMPNILRGARAAEDRPADGGRQLPAACHGLLAFEGNLR